MPEPRQPNIANRPLPPAVAVLLVLGALALGAWPLITAQRALTNEILGIREPPPPRRAPSRPAASRPRTVQYRVSGASQASTITFDDLSGGQIQHTDIALPWTSPAFEVDTNAYCLPAVCLAQNASGGSITVEILVDGQVAKSATSTGEYAIATAMADLASQ